MIHYFGKHIRDTNVLFRSFRQFSKASPEVHYSGFTNVSKSVMNNFLKYVIKNIHLPYFVIFNLEFLGASREGLWVFYLVCLLLDYLKIVCYPASLLKTVSCFL